MGDRCALTVTFHECDREVVEEILDKWDQEDPHPNLPGCLTVWFSEMNYGASNEREELAKRGVPFFGYHCAGDDYGPLAFAATNGKIDEIDADHQGKPSVQIDESSGLPSCEAQRLAKEYVERLKRARQALRQRARSSASQPQRIVVEVQGGLVQAVHGPSEPEVIVVDWDDRNDDRGPTVAGWDPTPLGEMAKETKDALKAEIPAFTFEDSGLEEQDGGDTTFCENPCCENPAIKQVPVSIEKPSDQTRMLCAACEEAYTWGVQHGQMTAREKPPGDNSPHDASAASNTLASFIREKGFIVIGWNRVDPSPGNPVEAWAYEGPLSFANSTPAAFGLGASCSEALTALSSYLVSRSHSTATPPD